MKDYINIVLSKINNKKQRTLIAEELEGHLNDRIDYYVNAGYDMATAIAKANAHMGRAEDAELAGEQLNIIHAAKYKVFIVAAFILVNLGSLYLFCNFLLFGFNDGFITGWLGMFFSAVYLIYVFIQLFTANKIKSAFLACSCAAMIGFHGLFMIGYVPSVFCFYEIFIGKGNELGDLLLNYTWQCRSVTVYVLSALFLVVSLVVSLCSVVQIIKFNELKNGRNYYKTEKKIKITIAVLLVFVISVTVSAWLLCKNQYNSSGNEWIAGFYLIESDERVDPQSIENYDDKRIELKAPLLADYDMDLICDSYEKEFDKATEDFDWDVYNENHPFQNSEFKEFYLFYDDLNHACKYKTLSISAELHTDKKYIMIIPFEDEENICFDKYEWIEVAEGNILKNSNREYVYLDSFIEYEIKLIPEK